MHKQNAGCVLTLSGFSRSAIAVPSARNSGLLRISKWTEGSEQFLLSTCSQINQCECTNSQHRSCVHLFSQFSHNHSDSSIRHHQAAKGNTGTSAATISVYTFSMASAVLTGTVDFSMTILLVLETLAIIRAAPSQYVRSAALPAPTPRVLVGVLTLQTKPTLSKCNTQLDPA